MLHSSGTISLSEGHMEKYTHYNLAAHTTTDTHTHTHTHTDARTRAHTHTHTDWRRQTHAATCTQMSTGNYIYTNAPINLSAQLSIFSGFACAALNACTLWRGGEERRGEGYRRGDRTRQVPHGIFLLFGLPPPPCLKHNCWPDSAAHHRATNSWKIWTCVNLYSSN